MIQFTASRISADMHDLEIENNTMFVLASDCEKAIAKTYYDLMTQHNGICFKKAAFAYAKRVMEETE